MAVTILATDVQEADDLLTALAEASVPDGDYTKGSALRDLAIRAIAYSVAYMRATGKQITVRQSLKSLTSVDVSDDADAADDAADEILSNWFATRNQGMYARVLTYAHMTSREDVTVAASTLFYKTSALSFQLNNGGQALFIPAEDLVAQFSADGTISSYACTIPLIATKPGAAYNIDPGVFAAFDPFNTNVMKVETLEKASYGDDKETTTAFVARSTNLVTVRNLINARSCDAVLRDLFEDIRTVTVVGMGDDEMARDLVEEKATNLRLHMGGHQDIFVDLPVTSLSFTGEVGAQFTRPDGVISIFRDATYAPGGVGHKFTQADIPTGLTPAAGMALRIWAGLPEGPKDYIIREVRDTELLISEKVPFTNATDETTPVTYVTWSIGQLMPNYQDVVGQQLTGETSRRVQNTGRITLPGTPMYAVTDVYIADASDADADPSDGRIHFYVRSNSAPIAAVAPDNAYQIIIHNPTYAQSAKTFAELLIGPVGLLGKYDGKSVVVTYEGVSGFSEINTYVAARNRRISGSNQLVRAFHPIYVGFSLEYRLKNEATDVVDEEAAAAIMIAYINSFSPKETLDVSVLGDYLKSQYTDISHVYPFTIEYQLYVPDGRVIEFSTTEDVTVPLNAAQLLAKLVYPGNVVEGLTDPLVLGLSDDVIRYLALAENVTVTQRTT